MAARRKRKKMMLSPNSERLVKRVACAMLFDALPWDKQNEALNKARDLLRTLAEVEP